jgi:GT2 family glycosyltransferase
VRYIFSGNNLGFGAAHNLVINNYINDSDLHLLLNPDILFDAQVLGSLVGRMERESSIGALMPRIIYPDGAPQYLHKLLPTPMDLFFRRFIPIKKILDLINKRYELQSLPQDRMSDIPSLSGCFLLVRSSLFIEIGGFDGRYFMYMEDIDLVRRIGNVARTIYDPSVYVTHFYQKGSYRNITLLLYHLISAVKYFNKWGWIYDPVRYKRNKNALALLKIKI